MTARPSSLSHHPAPHRHRLSAAKAALLVFGGPVAWLTQLCIGVALVSWPCYPGGDRLWAPLAGHEWTRGVAVFVLLLFALAALAVGLLAHATLREVRHEEDGGHVELLEIGQGRTRFVAIWGVALGYGSAIAAALTLIAFAMVPRCAG